MIKLSQQDRNLLYLTQLNAMEAVPALAKLLGDSEHATRRRFGRLANNNLVRKMPILNLSRLGYSRYELLFSRVTKHEEEKPHLFDALVKHPLTQFLGEVGGDYQAMLAVIARSFDELQVYLRFFYKHYEGTFSIDEILPVYSHTFMGTRSLAPSLPRQKAIDWRDSEERITIDDSSQNILYQFCNNSVSSISELARLVKMPSSTVSYRLNKMQEDGIIVGYFNAFDPVDLGMFPFNVLLSFRGITESIEKKLREICDEQPEVDMIVSYIGAWDYAVLCFVESARDIAPLVNRLQTTFGDQLSKHCTLPQFHTHVWREYNMLPEGQD